MDALLHGYQCRWLADKSRFKIGMFARQTGKTFTSTLDIVDDMVEAEAQGRRSPWLILSRGERQAMEAMNEGVKLHLRAYGQAFEDLGESDIRIGETVYRATEVVLPNGSKCTALPANPDTARGFSRNVYLDEFAFHKDSRGIWRALFPVVSRGRLRLVITSTPNGKSNKFYELWTQEGCAWSRHRVDIHQAVAEGLERDITELRSALGDEEAWRQEYELEFLDEATAWLSYEVITAVEDGDAGKPELYQGGPCIIGNDIARRGDLWVAWVWERVGDVFWTREIVELRGASFAAQDAEIARLMTRYQVERLVMDQTGMGEKPVEDAQARYGYRVEGVVLTSNIRLNVATLSKQRFEDCKVRIPAGNPVLRADLHKLKRVMSETGNPRLVADRDADGHADRTWAAFLGLAGASAEPGIIGYYRRQVEAQKEKGK